MTQRWTADVFVNSEVGMIKADVHANSISGAKQQIRAKYGDYSSLSNLNRVSEDSSFSSGSKGSSSGSGGSGGLFVLGAIALVVAGLFGGFDETPSSAPAASEPSYEAPSRAAKSTPSYSYEPESTESYEYEPAEPFWKTTSQPTVSSYETTTDDDDYEGYEDNNGAW